MSEAGHSGTPDLLPDQALDIGREIALLRLAGAERLDPVRLYHLQALAERANTHQGRVKQLLDARVVQVLQDLTTRLALAPADAMSAHATLVDAEPGTPLAVLARHIAQQTQQQVDADWGHVSTGAAGARPELKSVRYFRKIWSKLSVDKQVNKALDQAPKNAGPINSHMLVLRSLAMMRDISPDYLNRFMSYADTLLCLDQLDQAKQATIKKGAEGQSGKKVTGRPKAALKRGPASR